MTTHEELAEREQEAMLAWVDAKSRSNEKIKAYEEWVKAYKALKESEGGS